MKDREPGSPEVAAEVGTVAKGGAVQIAGQVTNRSFAFLFTVAAAELLSRVGFGLYRQVFQVLVVFGQLGLAGFNYSAMRFISRARAAEDHSGVRGAARASIMGAVIASAIVLVLLFSGADVVASAFGDDPDSRSELARLLRIGALYVPLFALMQVLRYCTQAYKTMVPSVIVGNIVQPAARFALGVGALLVGFEVAGALVTLVASMGIGVITGAYYYRRILSSAERAAAPRARPREMTRFALLQGGASLLGIQSLGLGVLVLGVFHGGEVEVGLFGIALALQGPGGIFLSGIVNIWAPVVSDLHEKGDIARLESLYQTITRWVATFSFPVFAALIIDAELFLRMFFPKWVDATSVVAVLAIGNFFYAGTGPTGYVISMTGRPGVNFANSIVAVALYAAAGAVVVPEHGALGMAVIDAVITALVNTARVVQAKILVGVQPFGRSLLKPVVATAVGAAALLLWRLVPSDSIPLELVGLAIAAAVYVIVLRRFGLDPEERYVWERIRARASRGRRRGGP
ncbi:MAG: oligosaccharide flippase family protein [Actinomycetota bacterium]